MKPFLCLLVLATWMAPAACLSGPVPVPKKGEYSILAFNVWYQAEDNQESLSAIREADPDIVCLLELTPKFVRDFKKHLGKRYHHKAFYPRRGTWGAGLASKYPLSRVKLFPARPHRIPALEANVRLGKKRVKVACLHLFPPIGKHKKTDSIFTTLEKNQKLRKNQARYLVSRYKNLKSPLLVVGDMNEDRFQDAMETFQNADILRACDQANQPKHKCGATYPGGAYLAPALFEIDHILGRRIRFNSAQVIREGSSDHYPVFAIFTPQ